DRLPVDRRPHWAYCRWLDVVRRINGRPQSAREWDEIEAEVQSIQRLTPGNWHGEYLRSKVAESRRTGRRTSSASGNPIIPRSAPEELRAPAPTGRFPRLLGRSRGGPAADSRLGADGPTASPPAVSGSTAGEQALSLPDSRAQPGARRGRD